MAKKKSSKTAAERGKEVDFETALAEVERIVSQLEGGDLDLTEALRQYEQGVRQLKNCHAILDQAERRVTMLSGFDADGNPVTEAMPGSGSTALNDGGGKGTLGRGEPGGSSIDDSEGLF